jgi:hypothetical protein
MQQEAGPAAPSAAPGGLTEQMLAIIQGQQTEQEKLQTYTASLAKWVCCL